MWLSEEFVANVDAWLSSWGLKAKPEADALF
jgi:hypothetical protein